MGVATKRVTTLTASRVSPSRAQDYLPVSIVQRRLWFLTHVSPSQPSFTRCQLVRIGGRLDPRKLQLSLDAICSRHDTLRAAFTAIEGKPLQWIAKDVGTNVQMLDLSSLDCGSSERALAKAISDLRRFTPDLSAPPLLQASLLRLAEDEHVFVLVAHEMIVDRASLQLLLGELFSTYATGKTQTGATNLGLQYSEYAAKQQKRLEGGEYAQDLEYWKNKLAASVETSELPADRSRPVIQSYCGAREWFQIEGPSLSELRAFCGREEVNLPLLFLTTFQTLLYRYNSQHELLMGMAFSNRHQAGLEEVIGPMSNTLVLRSKIDDQITFGQFLRQLGREVGETLAHAELPFEKLIHELVVERDLSHAPFFQVMFDYWDGDDQWEDSGLQLDRSEVDGGVTKFDLTLGIEEKRERAALFFEYNADLFNQETIRRMVGHFKMLLTAVVRDCGRGLAALPILTESEEHQLLVEWNSTEREYAAGGCIHQLFEAQVDRTPGTVALVKDGEQLTYYELNRRANSLAHHLRTFGIGPDDRVGLCLPRSVELVVAILGILKAGGAYVPLDPAYPSERLAFMLRDSGARLLVTSTDLERRLTEIDTRVVFMDLIAVAPDRANNHNLKNTCTPENLAYVIYTSGSTGRPKGVMIEHRSSTALINWSQDVFTPTELQRVLASTSICFDLSVFELFVPLSSGGTIVLVENVLHLAEQASAAGLTLVNTVPSAIAELSKAEALPASVTTINLAGEALRNVLAQQLYASETVKRVFNLYGPSEDTTYSTFFQVRKGATDEPSIGRPIANTFAYVLDRHIRPVPVGVAGELYLAGDGLARGYLNRARLTAEKFIPDPFAKTPGGRLYRTGDIVRYNVSGNIQFLGRSDQQVKIRGFRIEPGEIEAALTMEPAVGEKVVLARTDENNDKRLIAYIVWKNGKRSLDALRSSLKTRLPDYMIPSAFVELEKLPLMPNGKLDYRALPAPDKKPTLPVSYVEPRDSLELELVDLWEKLLAVSPIGVRDDFFELGGDSLLGARLFAQIENRFERKLPLATLFRTATIEQLAKIVRSEGWSPSWSSLVAIQPDGSRPPLLCVHACGPHVFIYRPLVRHLGPDQPVFGFQAIGLDGVTPPHEYVEEMASHYINELRAFQPQGPYYLLGDTLGGLIALEMSRQLKTLGEQVAFLGMIDTFCPLPPSLARRLRGHLGHLRQLGISGYFKGAAQSVARKFRRRLGGPLENRLTSEERDFAKSVESSNGQLGRLDWAIYLATQVNYVTPKSYAGKLTYFLARDNQYEQKFEDNRTNWKRIVDEFDLFTLPGRHDTLKQEPYVATLAEKLTACLEEAYARHSK